MKMCFLKICHLNTTYYNGLKIKTFSIKEEQLEKLRNLPKETGVPQSLLIRMAIDDLLKDKERLKKKII